MDFFEELEQMALNAADEQLDIEDDPSQEVIARWQQLFDYSPVDAADLIKQRRNNYTRIRVSNEHWEMVRSAKEGQGYDREA